MTQPLGQRRSNGRLHTMQLSPTARTCRNTSAWLATESWWKLVRYEQGRRSATKIAVTLPTGAGCEIRPVRAWVDVRRCEPVEIRFGQVPNRCLKERGSITRTGLVARKPTSLSFADASADAGRGDRQAGCAAKSTP
jgi:hypothetical protein